MKFVIAILIAVFSFAANAQASKMTVCMDYSILASVAYDMKASKQKLVYPKGGSPIERKFMKEAMQFGYYKAKSSQDAIERGHVMCATSKLWAENNKNVPEDDFVGPRI
jgi:hypothetical protein